MYLAVFMVTSVANMPVTSVNKSVHNPGLCIHTTPRFANLRTKQTIETLTKDERKKSTVG